LPFGIPPFKLEKDVMARRREIFAEMGIEFVLSTEVGCDTQFDQLVADFDAIFVGTGTYTSIKGGLSSDDIDGVYEALPYLIGNTCLLMNLPQSHEYDDLRDQRVVVHGGGDTAMDCVWTAVRQGAKEVICAYRRDEKNMPGSRREVKNAHEEGVQFLWNFQPLELVSAAGQLSGVRAVRTEMGEPDDRGRRRPIPVEGPEYVLEADAVIIAFGFQPSPPVWLAENGVKLDERRRIAVSTGSALVYQTTNEKIFAGGDAVRGSDLVVTAIAEGREVAESILEYLVV
jgi:glutamate synthase (NADPH/NADH) small chain